MNRGEEEPVHSITGAASPHSDDLDARIRRYLISMSLRVVCVVMAIVVHAQWRHWSWWLFAIGAVILPYIAVVMANAVDKRRSGAGPAPVTPQIHVSLPSSGAPVDEQIKMTIHEPERPIRPDSRDKSVSAQSFAQDNARPDAVFAADSPTSSEPAG
ncbi:DUF3099 domain-containing protein [Kineosporia babensis]|uniref:DUF3099 domain-containing protein n=1 Tax=Kineosporia babensis TaxID=499548 RepID=A0A9X1NED5_9ACTN|nr:DUF3099 domain-containing protein [Kineosporia babensis]